MGITRVWRKVQEGPLKQPDRELKNLQGSVGVLVEDEVGSSESEDEWFS